MTYLVTGASGHVGREVTRQLAAAGLEVRAMTRTPGRTPAPDGVQVVAGDLTRPDSLGEALRGIERLYLFPVPETASEVVARAVRAGVRRIVVLSSSSVHDETTHSGAHHRAVERAVEDSGVEWTFVRPDEFANNLLWKWGHSIRTEGVVRAPYPEARRALIHERDVAAVAAAALMTDGHAGARYELTGPELLDQPEQVARIAAVTGTGIRFEEVTPRAAREEMIRFMPEPVVDMVLGYLVESVANPPAPLPTVEKVTGRPATPFDQWVRDHRAQLVG
ncbi:NAD(P)H-binding protein [Streptomyces chartreusis]|uniref:ChaX n=1 Tax=Streptomyces chartreusis TaxID=1969 RepID=A0A346RP17_STRCX|nr:NAD(P)H-binding protein [Streptomyces chartreusis]AXS67814.1 ChaX [Streptomyces chartreusis]QKZ16794.1 NAD(P)H-binding protein [Streptomyces chartreusis]